MNTTLLSTVSLLIEKEPALVFKIVLLILVLIVVFLTIVVVYVVLRGSFNFFEMGYLLPRDHTFKAYVDQWLNLRQKDGKYQEIFDGELEKIRRWAVSKK